MQGIFAGLLQTLTKKEKILLFICGDGSNRERQEHYDPIETSMKRLFWQRPIYSADHPFRATNRHRGVLPYRPPLYLPGLHEVAQACRLETHGVVLHYDTRNTKRENDFVLFEI